MDIIARLKKYRHKNQRLKQMQQTLTIPGQLPSFTQISKSSRYDKTSKETTVAISYLAQQMLKPLCHPADFSFHWICKSRRQAKDNIVGSRKYILNGLVQAKILPNDGWEWVLDFHDTFSVDRTNPRVIVTITPRAQDG